MSLLLDLIKEKKFSSLFNSVLKKKLFGKKVTTSIEDASAFFVLSTGRVGTQTVAAILSNSPEALALHEPSPLLYSLSVKSYAFNDPQAREILSRSFLLLREEHIRLSQLNEQSYIETSPQCTFLAPAIKKALPNTKFLHLVRRPKKVIKSGMNREWYSGHPYDKFRIIPRETSPFYKKWDSFSPLEKNVWLWTETNNWIYNFLSGISDNEKLMLHSEDIFRKNQKVIEALFEFFGTEKIDDRKITKVLSKKLNNNKKSEIDELDIQEIDSELLEYYNIGKSKMEF